MVFKMHRILATLVGLSLALAQSGHAAELKILVRDAHGKLVADAVDASEYRERQLNLNRFHLFVRVHISFSVGIRDTNMARALVHDV